MILGILQARCSSTRLPGKVLKPIVGKPMLQLQLERLQQSKKMDQMVVATSMEPSDQPLVELCADISVPCMRGSLNDVLDRFYKAALAFQPDHVVRLTGDCPLADPDVIDQVIDFYLEGQFEYASNTIEPTYPNGLDLEVLSFDTLCKIWKEAILPSEREHVTAYVQHHRERFKLGSFVGKRDLSHLRWTVDYPADFVLVQKIFEQLYPHNSEFTTEDVLNFIEQHSELQQANTHLPSQGSYHKSVEEQDPAWLSQNKETIAKSLVMQERAEMYIPGMTQVLSKHPDRFSRGAWPTYYQKAIGAEVWDLDGNHYIDMSIGGSGATVLGYADPDVNEAVIQAVQAGGSCSLNCPEDLELAALLCALHPWADQVRYARTGSESMTMAVRTARAVTGREKVAVCGYHGWPDWSLATNLDNPYHLEDDAGLESKGVPKRLAGTSLPFRYNQLDELQKIVDENGQDLAAIIIEPFCRQASTPEFLTGVRDLASAMGAVLIVNEISTGFRICTGGAHLQFGLEPDMAVFSNAISNGYPMGAVIGKKEVMEAVPSTFISSTDWTDRMGPAAALATIRKFQRCHVSERLIEVGKQVQTEWKEVAERYHWDVRVEGMPPISHFDFRDENAPILQALFTQLMLDHGFLACDSFYAMFAHQEKHIKQYFQAVNVVLADLLDLRRKGDLGKKLIGQPAVLGYARLNQ